MSTAGRAQRRRRVAKPGVGGAAGEVGEQPGGGGEPDRPHDDEGGIAIRSELDEGSYPTGRAVSQEQMESLCIRRDKFHGEWNYTLQPRE